MIILAVLALGFAVLGLQMALQEVLNEFRDWTAILTYKPFKCRYKSHFKYRIVSK